MKPQFIVDSSGKKVSVVLSMAEYQKLIDDLDDKYCSELYQKALKLNEPSILLEDYIRNQKSTVIGHRRDIYQ